MRNTFSKITLVLALVATSITTAQAHTTTCAEEEASPKLAPPPQVRSPLLARRLTLGTYLGSWALALGSITVVEPVGDDPGVPGLTKLALVGVSAAPIVGYAYAGETGKGLLLSAASFGGGFLFASTFEICEYDCSEIKETLNVLGFAIHVAATSYAMHDSANAAQRTNEKARNLMVAPTLVGTEIGIGIGGAF